MRTLCRKTKEIQIEKKYDDHRLCDDEYYDTNCFIVLRLYVGNQLRDLYAKQQDIYEWQENRIHRQNRVES